MTTAEPVAGAVICRLGEPAYDAVLGRLRTDRALLDPMRVQAGFELDEHPDKVWVFAVDGAGRPLAWCAYEPSDEPGIEIKAVDSCERPECWDDDLYLLVYTARHELVRHHTVETYVYGEPVELHEMDGWTVVETGGTAPCWYRMTRTAD